MPNKNGSKRSLIPVQLKWDEAGISAIGRLLSKEKTMYMDNVRGRYLIAADDGLKVFLGTFQIDQAMEMVPVGSLIGITYLGSEGTNKGNTFKTFDIWVDDEAGVNVETGEVEESFPF